ncbi:rhodanese-like domain-containing protein [Lentzea sp. BCCO 10_0798]|uniref:Rhodanese-like domain-containing protein n=1 Tax=Lentzea kristufekii TaxID=3095430 RepID=A0ABU4TZU3_9PSEU|nr:rhodanese-like domain-containing protein [Lentzea sp. BCCO 10_0798]MDX8053839.1 rhodanese-like domain-containing protein [Lentzea sp. BCCO 10_0798]
MNTPSPHNPFANTSGDVDPTTAHQAVSAGDAVLLDVRETDEYTVGHAPGAVHLPLSRLRDGAEPPVDLGQRPVFAICRSGARSAIATQILVDRGHTAANVVGGMHAWHQAGLPVVDERGGNGTVA